MAKIYSFEKFKIRQRIKQLQSILDEKKDRGLRFGFLYGDHYYITNIHKEIVDLNEQLQKIENQDVEEVSAKSDNKTI